MTTLFIDANVPMYAAGRPHALREPCRALLRAVARGELTGVTSVEVLQELLHRYFQEGRRQEGLRVFDSFRTLLSGEALGVDAVDMARARERADDRPRAEARDLVHLAVMERHAITRIVTADRHFDGIEGIERLDPADFADQGP